MHINKCINFLQENDYDGKGCALNVRMKNQMFVYSLDGNYKSIETYQHGNLCFVVISLKALTYLVNLMKRPRTTVGKAKCLTTFLFWFYFPKVVSELNQVFGFCKSNMKENPHPPYSCFSWFDEVINWPWELFIQQ